MRTDISVNWFSRFRGLDLKKLIIIVFLLRLIAASAYDIGVSVTGKDPLLPDSRFYSVRGRYTGLLLQGHDATSLTKDLLPGDSVGDEIFIDTLRQEHGVLPSKIDEPNVYSYIVGLLYALFGCATIWVRIFNIVLSMASACLLYDVARRLFGDLAANLFLVAALLLPTQAGYSITLARDFLRVFAISLSVWVLYRMGDIWKKRPETRSYC